MPSSSSSSRSSSSSSLSLSLSKLFYSCSTTTIGRLIFILCIGFNLFSLYWWRISLSLSLSLSIPIIPQELEEYNNAPPRTRIVNFEKYQQQNNNNNVALIKKNKMTNTTASSQSQRSSSEAEAQEHESHGHGRGRDAHRDSDGIEDDVGGVGGGGGGGGGGISNNHNHNHQEEEHPEKEDVVQHNDTRSSSAPNNNIITTSFSSANIIPKSRRKQLVKIHMWDDTTHQKPREEILVEEGWYQYQNKTHIFIKELNPNIADIIIWITTMARHDDEIAPLDTNKYKNKVIVLDYADGCTIHNEHSILRKSNIEIGYFKRSFIERQIPQSIYKINCTTFTEDEKSVIPYAYSGSKAMMIPYNSIEANINYEAVTNNNNNSSISSSSNHSTATTSTNTSTTTNENKTGYDGYADGYYQDERYENFLIPYQERKWTITNVLKTDKIYHNTKRIEIVKWTKEYVKSLELSEVKKKQKSKQIQQHRHNQNDNFTYYIGTVQSGCSGLCFGKNYLRHLRDSQIVITCNPYEYEGDFRLWETFLSGSLVFIDYTVILSDKYNFGIPHPLIDGIHWIQYDPSNRTDFITKLHYYSTHINEAQRIAQAGYEYVLKYHMPINRVEYILNKIRI